MHTNKLVWQQHLREMCFSGMTVTAGGLVFVGRNDGRLTALDSSIRLALLVAGDEPVSGEMLKLWLQDAKKRIPVVDDPDQLPLGTAAKVGAAAGALARALRAAGGRVEVARLPLLPGADKTGLDDLLRDLNIQALRKNPAISLSGGERRRVEIARALAADPSIMLLDEPFAGIDPISISDIRGLVKQLKNRQIGVLITDHNVRETLDIVDRACIIYDGRVLFSGSPQDLVADENVRRLYLGESFSL